MLYLQVHFQCVIQVCRHECPQPTCESESSNDFMANSDGDKKFNNRMGNLLPGATHQSTARSTVVHATSVTSQPNIESNQTVSSYGISGTGGMPRALNLNKLRRKREMNKEQKTDVSTQKVIQVVAPGDVAFNLPLTNGNGPDGQSQDVVQRRLYMEEGNVICMSTTGFAAGLVFLILLLLLTCIITIFLIIRLRNLPTTNSKEQVLNLHCPNHPNTPCSCELSLVQPQYYLQIPAIQFANM